METKTQKAILIDAESKEVKEVDYNDYKDIQSILRVSIFTTGLVLNDIQTERGDTLFVDDEGLINGTEHFFALYIDNQGHVFAGNGLIVGPENYNDDGDYLGTDNPSHSLNWIKNNVKYLSREQVANRAY